MCSLGRTKCQAPVKPTSRCANGVFLRHDNYLRYDGGACQLTAFFARILGQYYHLRCVQIHDRSGDNSAELRLRHHLVVPRTVLPSPKTIPSHFQFTLTEIADSRFSNTAMLHRQVQSSIAPKPPTNPTLTFLRLDIDISNRLENSPSPTLSMVPSPDFDPQYRSIDQSTPENLGDSPYCL